MSKEEFDLMKRAKYLAEHNRCELIQYTYENDKARLPGLFEKSEKIRKQIIRESSSKKPSFAKLSGLMKQRDDVEIEIDKALNEVASSRVAIELAGCKLVPTVLHATSTEPQTTTTLKMDRLGNITIKEGEKEYYAQFGEDIASIKKALTKSQIEDLVGGFEVKPTARYQLSYLEEYLGQ